MARLLKGFDAYWKRVIPGDRERVTFAVGHPDDPETFLHPADWYLPNVPWNHQQVSRGAKQAGTWWITATKKARYRFEVRRWPSEVDAPLTGVPTIDETVDAWDASGGKVDLLYSNGKSPFVALPIAFVRLKVGEFEAIKKVDPTATAIAFELPLEARDYEVKTEFLDEGKEVLAGGYYVYCSAVTP